MKARLHQPVIKAEATKGLPTLYAFSVMQPNESGGRTNQHASIEATIGEVTGSIWFTANRRALKEQVFYCSADTARLVYATLFEALSQDGQPTLRLATWHLLSKVKETIRNEVEAKEFVNWTKGVSSIPDYVLRPRLSRLADSTSGIAGLSWRDLADRLIGGSAG